MMANALTIDQGRELELFKRIKDGDRQAEEVFFRKYEIIERVKMLVRVRSEVAREDRDDLIGEILAGIVINQILEPASQNCVPAS